MLKLHERIDTLPSAEKLPAWIFAVARNAIIDHRRKSAVREHATLDEAQALGPQAERDAMRELAPCLRQMIEHLPEPYRAAMKLVDLQGISHQELADRQSITLSAAKSRVQRARRQLREMIHDCCEIEQNARGEVVDYQTTQRTPRYCGPNSGPCG
jgi:RNA polymerase sigma-70 factor (ECF subfamily)